MDETSNIITKVFKTMEYGNNTETTNEAIAWLNEKNSKIRTYIDKPEEAPSGAELPIRNVLNDEVLYNIYIPEDTVIDKIITKCVESKNKWADVSAKEKLEVIFKFANEIKKNEAILSQLEIVARGILGKDTKNYAVPLLTDYLKFYASFSLKMTTGATKSCWKPEGISVGVVNDKSSLSSLGLILGPCLAAGYNIVLQTGPRISVVASFLSELAIKAGIPVGTIKIIAGNETPRVYFTHEKVSVITIFDDLYKEKYLISNNFCQKIINFSSNGSPMLIFDNCDLDSACQCAVDSAWTYQGMLPWAVRNILVQENIFEIFMKKLKAKLIQVKIGFANNSNVDFSYPINVFNFQEEIKKASAEGVEVFSVESSNDNLFTPTLFIGGNITNNNVIKENPLKNLPVITVTAFRTINEAAALANNTRDGLAASIWTESTSLAHEISRKLKTSNIWINSHGLFSPDISLSPYKASGNGYFGGSDGFKEYIENPVEIKIRLQEPLKITTGSMMEKAISEAKKAAESWSKLSRLERCFTLQQIALALNKKHFDVIKEEWIETCQILIGDYISENAVSKVSSVINYNVVTFSEPCGVIAVENLTELDEHNKKILIAGLIEGNAIILLNEDEVSQEFYSWLSTQLPTGVLSVVSNSQDAVKTAALHKELNVFIGAKENSCFRTLPLKTFTKFRMSSNEEDWSIIKRKVTLVKNVWFNVGQSFI